jgi:DNA-binding phage protein
MTTKKWEMNYPSFAKAVEDSGLKIVHIAKSAGLTYRQLYGRLTNETDFELPVMRKLSKTFGITMDGLFNDKKIC